MKNRLANKLIAAINIKDAELILQKYDEICEYSMSTFRNADDMGFDEIVDFCEVTIACVKYKAFNNMNDSATEEGKNTYDMLVELVNSGSFTADEIKTMVDLEGQLHEIYSPLQKQKNLVVPRYDTACTLCKKKSANKTGSHMVPNFLTAPTFSFDGKGKRFREALNHDFMNKLERNCSFYGCDVPPERFAQGQGKTEVTEDDIENNINQII